MTKQLLIIDDDISLCKMLEILFKDMCDVTSFYDTNLAAKYIEENGDKIAVIMLDYNIGNDDGVSFYIKEIQSKKRNIPAILVSGFIVTQLKSDDELKELLTLFDRVIEKPFDFVELKNYIQSTYFEK